MERAAGKPGWSISERHSRNAPFSSHSNVARPRRVVPGTKGCVPVVAQLPTNTPKSRRAGLGMDAACMECWLMIYAPGLKQLLNARARRAATGERYREPCAHG